MAWRRERKRSHEIAMKNVSHKQAGKYERAESTEVPIEEQK